MEEDLMNKLGFLGDSTAFQQILQGNFSPPSGTNQYMKELFKSLKYPHEINNKPKAIIIIEMFQ